MRRNERKERNERIEGNDDFMRIGYGFFPDFSSFIYPQTLSTVHLYRKSRFFAAVVAAAFAVVAGAAAVAAAFAVVAIAAFAATVLVWMSSLSFSRSFPSIFRHSWFCF